ncbi:MAG: hypothetical protein ACRCZ2_04325 [Fusobacteriaceae bacterium]
MSIIRFEDYRVEEDYMSNLEYIKDFTKLSKKYKMGCDFAYIEGLDFRVIKETPTIYCYNHKVAIYPKNSEVCEAHIMASVNFEKRFIENGIAMIEHEEEMANGEFNKSYQWGESGEFALQFYIKDLDKVVDIFKIKKANKTSTNPHSLKNLHEYLRFARNIDPWYGQVLEERLLANNEED